LKFLCDEILAHESVSRTRGQPDYILALGLNF